MINHVTVIKNSSIIPNLAMIHGMTHKMRLKIISRASSAQGAKRGFTAI